MIAVNVSNVRLKRLPVDDLFYKNICAVINDLQMCCGTLPVPFPEELLRNILLGVRATLGEKKKKKNG